MKQLRKNDGYVLPYVLVVFLVLSLVAVTICSISLNNLRAQQDAVQRSRELYETEGLVEQVVAELTALEIETTESYTQPEQATSMAEAAFWMEAESLRPEESGVTIVQDGSHSAVTITATGGEGTVTVTATLRLTLALGTADTADSRLVGTAKVVTWDYDAYDIARSVEEGGAA